MRPSTSLITGRAVWKSKNSSGSIVAKRWALSCGADERQRGGGGVAGVVPALERAHQRGGAKPVGTAIPDQWLHPIHRTSWARGACRHNRADHLRAARGRRDRCRLRVHAQGPPDGARPARRISRSSCATAAARSPRARSVTPTCSRGASSAATSCASPAASTASATSCRSRCARSRARPRRRPTRRRSCRPPTATSTSSRASSSTWCARCTTRSCAGCSSRSSATPSCAPRCAAHPARARDTTPTSAGCSSTPSRWRPWRYDLCQLHPRLDADLLISAAIVHDLGKTREFTYGADIGLTDEGRLLGHLALGQRIVEQHASAVDDARRLALLHCVLCHHGADAAPGRRFASAEALALYRLNALDASVKGAFEQGL